MRRARMEPLPFAPGGFCIIETVMLLYNNVAQLRQFVGAHLPSTSRHGRASTSIVRANTHSAGAGAVHLDFQVADFLAQRIAVDAKQVGGADLISARRRKCR
jgi:hypothetical protein